MYQQSQWTSLIEGMKVGDYFEFTCEREIDEILISFNFLRGKASCYEIYFSFDQVKKFLIATLGKGFQKSYRFHEALWGLNQDIIFFNPPKYVKKFQVEIRALYGECLPKDCRAYASISHLKKFAIGKDTYCETLELESHAHFLQFDSPHPRRNDICSPTSITHASLMLKKGDIILPHLVAECVYDSGFDIYGNWMFGVAYAFELLAPHFKVVVQRLHSFEAILNQLKKGAPVCVSVKGELPGVKPYLEGHLLTVIGYQAACVICLDSANQEVKTFYPIDAFLKVWGARQNLAYVFEKIV